MDVSLSKHTLQKLGKNRQVRGRLKGRQQKKIKDKNFKTMKGNNLKF